MRWIDNVKRIVIDDEEYDDFIYLETPSEDDLREFCIKYGLNEDRVFDYVRKNASFREGYFFFNPRKLDNRWRE